MKKITGIITLLTFVLLIIGACIFYQISNVSAEEQQASQASGSSYLGMEKCRNCHPTQFKDFEKRKFSKAWNVLVMRHKTTDPACLKCHTTGFGKPSGFTSEEATPHLKFKQCEACHGPGSKHASNPGDKGEREALRNNIRINDVCIDCHHCMTTHKEESF